LKKLFIHIGMNKTGTSAIQQFLNDERNALLDLGLLFPNTGCAGVAHYAFSRMLGFDHGAKSAPEAEQKALLNQLDAEVKQSQCEICVISSENFVLPRSADLVARFFKGFDCKIVVYLRRHDHWWVSAYNQAVKMVENPPWVRGFEGFLNFNRNKSKQVGNYRALLERWSNTFGKENIIVRPFEREQNQPNIVADFLTAIGCAPIFENFSEYNLPCVNQSLDFRTICLIDIFQRMNVDQSTRQLLIDHVTANANPKGCKQFLSPEERRKLVDERKGLYEYIAKTYLNRADGRLFLEPLPDPRADWATPKTPSMVEVAEIVADVLSPNH